MSYAAKVENIQLRETNLLLIRALEVAAAGFAVLATNSDNEAIKKLASANFNNCKNIISKANDVNELIKESKKVHVNLIPKV